MKRIALIALMIPIFFSCDPLAQMEANIENLTAKKLSVVFMSSDSSISKTLEIDPNQNVFFQEGFDIGNTYLEPYLSEYDSVVIKNQADEILKVYKRNDVGKNIYNIDVYWISTEPSKRFFKYEYEIENEDIE